MSISRRALIVLSVFLFVGVFPSLAKDEKTIADAVDTKKLESFLGKSWSRDRGLMIESENAIKDMKGTEKAMAEMLLGMMKQHGVVACGDFSYTRTDLPANNVTIRVYKFGKVEDAVAFRELKYEDENIEALYKRSKEGEAIVFDSLQTKKRILFQGEFWITCGHIGDDDLHLKVLEAALDL